MTDFVMQTRVKGNTDEWLTPESAVYPLIPWLKKDSTIWCPFDKDDSAFVKVLSKQFKVIATHIDTGNDFFETNVEECDYIISNFPYSLRMPIFERLFKLDKPFAMLCNYAGLWDSKQRFEWFKKYGIELLILKGRTKFRRVGIDGNGSSPLFQSIYVCHNVLPRLKKNSIYMITILKYNTIMYISFLIIIYYFLKMVLGVLATDVY